MGSVIGSSNFSLEVLKVQDSSGFDDIGAPIWKLALCVFLVYCLLYFSLFKGNISFMDQRWICDFDLIANLGVKSSGKVVWITATMPYLLLSILLVRGLMLPGALKGLHFYLIPDLARLADAQVW